MKKYKFTYENSGVNINAADNFVKYIANLENKKKNSVNNNNIGNFASITSIPKGIKKPLLIIMISTYMYKLTIKDIFVERSCKLVLI